MTASDPSSAGERTAPRARADVAIVGASLAGLALARALAVTLPGIAITVVAGSKGGWPQASPDPRAYALAAGSRRLLEAIDVWPRVARDAEPVRSFDITDSALESAVRPVLLQYEARIGTDEPSAHIVPDAALREALLAIVRETSGVIWCAEDATGLAAERQGAMLTLASGGRIAAGLVVAADGGRSLLREIAGIGVVDWTYPQLGIVTVIAHDEPHQGRATQHFLPGGPFAILPMTGNRSCITWSEEEATARRIMALDDASFLAELGQRAGHRLGRLTLAGPRMAFPLRFQLARRLTAPRLALIADAAHLVHPLAGQGLNLGLRDVACLVETIAGAMRVGLSPGDASALERYERWRRFDNATSAMAFDAINRLFSRPEGVLRSLREAALGLVDRLDGLKTRLVTEASGLTGDVPLLLRGERP